MKAPEGVRYVVEIVGGPFDAARALRWLDDGDSPPPEVIWLGVCQGDGQCYAGDRLLCKSKGGGKAHVSYWLTEEDDRPAGCVPYALEHAFLTRDEHGQVLDATARYVIGGLLAPQGAVEAAELPSGVAA